MIARESTYSPKAPLTIAAHGFTLIELLIVVLIIAILAAVAMPNFLEFQMRAKISRAQSDLRALAAAIETYGVDNGTYPALPLREFHLSHQPAGTFKPPETIQEFYMLSTPISYISHTRWIDPFLVNEQADENGIVHRGDFFAYTTLCYSYANYQQMQPIMSATFPNVYANGPGWGLKSSGPDREAGPAPYNVRSDGALDPIPPGVTSVFESMYRLLLVDPNATRQYAPWKYDPTNGTVSPGDIYRFGP